MKCTSRSDFPDQLPNYREQYCWVCHAPGTYQLGTDKIMFHCDACGADSERTLIFDPTQHPYFDSKGRLVHNSCGVFVIRSDGKILLFKRKKYPYLLTIPAGHREEGESPATSAIREAQEEIGLQLSNLEPVYEGTIENEPCLGGADIHHWHAYLSRVRGGLDVSIGDEGGAWGWYESAVLNPKNTVSPVLYLLEQENVRKKISGQ